MNWLRRTFIVMGGVFAGQVLGWVVSLIVMRVLNGPNSDGAVGQGMLLLPIFAVAMAAGLICGLWLATTLPAKSKMT